jgi:hypothetical protein
MLGIADYINYAQNAGFTGNDLRNMVAIAWAESKGNPNAYNPAYGATGITQITPPTWQDFGQRFGYNNIYDPQQNFNAAYNIFSGKPYGGGFGKWEPYTVASSHPNHFSRYLPMVDAELAKRGGSQPQPLGMDAGQVYQQGRSPGGGQPPAPQAGRVPGVAQPFNPPTGSINDWNFDQATGRWYEKQHGGKNWDDVPFYHLENGQWQPYRKSGQQSTTRNKLMFTGDTSALKGQTSVQTDRFGQAGQQSSLSQAQSNQIMDSVYGQRPSLDDFYGPPSLDSFYTPTPKPQGQRQPFYQSGMEGAERALGPGGMTWAQEEASRKNNTYGKMPKPSGLFGNMAGFNRPVDLNQFGQGAPYMASLAARGQTIQQQPHFQPPMNMLPNGFMGFGPGRPQLPTTPMGNGMFSTPQGNYTANGLRLSQMQSGLY